MYGTAQLPVADGWFSVQGLPNHTFIYANSKIFVG